MAFAASMAHWQDVGGSWAASRGTSIRGAAAAVREDLPGRACTTTSYEIIKANVRFPDLAMGDFRAQVARSGPASGAVMQLLERYGRTRRQGSIQRIYEPQRKWRAQAVRPIPDGVYEAE